MYIKVRATPDAKKEKVEKETETVYRIQVREPAKRNLANNRIRELLASEFGLVKGKVQIVSGHRSPSKVFDVIKS